MPKNYYRPGDYSKKEINLVKKFKLQRDDAKLYFTSIIKPRLDRAYKLYIADNTDRAKQIKKWQANIAVPYIQAVVETLKPRILDARPDFTVQGRNQDDQAKAAKIQSLGDYTWEIAEGGKVSELLTSASLIYGTGYIQPSWKKDIRKHKFLSTKDLAKKKYNWVEKKETFYDAPYVEWVDNYTLWYDWHNISADSKQYWFRRLILSGAEIKRRYPFLDKKKLQLALESHSGDLKDYGSIRNEVKFVHEKITKGSDYQQGGSGIVNNIHQNQSRDPDLQMHEVFEWYQPFQDSFSVWVNDIPPLKKGDMPFPYDFKESPFIDVPYLRIPGEFEGYGLPMILENPQIMLNMIKNQRLDAMALNIHKMWIVNPLANINKEQLITRPFGIIYSTDPNGAREVQMSDIKTSAYKEEEMLKGDMRYGSGVDDFSMGVAGSAGSATETRHLRESTLERVRLFINHLGEGYAKLLRYWISMYRQFFTRDMIIRITGEEGDLQFPIIEKDDLKGQFDFKASVIPSIAGQNDVKKKQDMDLFQLLVEMPFIDAEKLTSKVLHDWNWNLESLKKTEEEALPIPERSGAKGRVLPPREMKNKQIPKNVSDSVMNLLSGGTYQGRGAKPSPMAEAKTPINLLRSGSPPTARRMPTTNSRGLNRRRGAGGGGKVNTNVPLKAPNTSDAQLLNRARNIQK